MMKRSTRAAAGPVASALLAGLSTPAWAAETSPGIAAPAELQQRLDREERTLHDLEQALAAEHRRLDADRQLLETYRQTSAAELAEAAGRGTAMEVASAQPTPVGEAPGAAANPPATSTAQIFDEPTALTPRGKFVFEPAVQYVHSTNNQVALVGYTVLPALTIGLIDVQRIESNLTDVMLTGRFGLLSRLELEVKVPYVRANTMTATRPLATASQTDSFFDSSGSGIGDAEVALRTQINHFRGDNVVWVGSLRFKSRTGTDVFEEPLNPATGLQSRLATGSGFNAVQPGVTFIFPSDPAVFFGGAAYTYSFSRDVGYGFGRVDPGPILDLSMGMGLALNDRAAFSVGYQHSIVEQTSQPEAAPGLALSRTGTLQLGTLRFGVSYRFTDKLNINTTLGIGVTRDSPDLELTLRLPYRF